MFGKRGLSSVVVVVLMILFVLASIFLVWVPLSDLFKSTEDSVNTDKFSVNLEIYENVVVVDEANSYVFVNVYRPAGDGEVIGVAVVVDYSSGLSDSSRVLVNISELDVKMVNISYNPAKGNLTKISIAPIFDNNGEQYVGFVTDEYDFDNGNGGGRSSACSDGVDNDFDNWTDLEDPGCSDLSDEDEYNAETGFECSDWIDNDGDGLYDGEDPDCDSWDDSSENSTINLACSDGVDNDGDGLIDDEDFGCIDMNDDSEKGSWSFTRPRRLIHFQTVGFSNQNLSQGQISNNIWNHHDGWNAAVDNQLVPVVNEIGDGKFDVVFWQIGGSWSQYKVWLPGDGEGDSTSYSSFLFEALTIAEDELIPEITDYSVLESYTSAHGIRMMAYIGMPRCQDNRGDDAPEYIPVPEHCYTENFDYYQGELMNGDFIAVGYDYSAGHLSEESPAYPINFAIMQDKGVEPYVEAVPPRDHPWNLGYSVWASQERWDFTENNLDRFYSEQEINDAGGVTLHGIRSPPDGTCSDGDIPCIRQWQWDKSVELLKDGKHITVNLKLLLDAGLDISCLAELAEDPNSNCAG